MCQCKKTQIYKDVIRERTTRIDYDYRVGDQVLVGIRSAHKYKTPFKGPYETAQTWTNRTVILRTGEVTTRINIRHINPYNNPNI